jgi:hypothetical protein
VVNDTTSVNDLSGLEYYDGTNWLSVSNNRVTIPAGTVSIQIRVLAISDSIYEGVETFSLQATAIGTTKVGSSSIDDIPPTLLPIMAATALEGAAVLFTVTMGGIASHTTVVDLAIVNGTTGYADFGTLQYFNGSTWVAATNNQAIISAGQTSVQVRANTVANNVYEGVKTFALRATANGSTQLGNGSITDNPPTITSVSAASAIEGSPLVFTVALSGTSTTATNINLAVSNGTTSIADLGALEYFDGTNWMPANGGQAIIAAGQASVQVRVNTVDDTIVESTEQFSLTASVNGSSQTSPGTITDNDVVIVPLNIVTPGTTGKDTISGGTANDLIQGGGGIDLLRGFDGSDLIYAGSQANPNSAGNANMYGDAGNDTLYGGGTGLNKLNGTNDTLLGVGEQDVLYGGSTTGSTSSVDTFVLGNINSCYYLGTNDYAIINNFDPLKDKIQLSGASTAFSTRYSINNSVAGVSSISYIDPITSVPNLIAKVNTATPLIITNSYFIQAPATIIL